MSSTTDQLQPPPTAVVQQAYSNHSDHGSVGPVIAVLAVITILGAIAGMIGRLCSGRRVRGHGQYDVEGWVEKKCSSCLDGRVDLPQRPPSATAAGDDIPVATPLQIPQEIKEKSQQGPRDHNLQASGGCQLPDL